MRAARLPSPQGERRTNPPRVLEALAVEPTPGTNSISQARDLPQAVPVNDPGPPWARVDLGPPLPMPVYTAHETWNPERIGALAIYCSDGRWGEAFDEFCHKRLLIPRYDRWAVPGGPAWLVPRDSSGDLYQATRTQLDFLVHVHELERIVLITHFGCAFYRQLLGQPAEDCVAAQLDDLREVSRALRVWFPDLQVEAYLAMQRGKCLSFHQLEG